MAYCSNCGTELNAQQDVCLKCGVSVAKSKRKTEVEKGSKANIGWGVLSFLFPIVGLILYLSWKESDPLNSSMAAKGGLIGFILGFIVVLFGL